MPVITAARPILLSAPYAEPDNLERRRHLTSGYRTVGLVEITFADGSTGLGEGYLAVFAPLVFAEIVKLLAPTVIGREGDAISARLIDLSRMTDYWSLTGAARHVLSAFEIALVDAKAKRLGVPAVDLFGGRTVERIALYGSGGDSTTPAAMQAEIDLLASEGIRLFKIRARRDEVEKAVWTMDRAGEAGIAVAIDMTQNLANPAQTASDVIAFVEAVHGQTARRITFLEEALGPADIGSYRLLRGRLATKIAGGEIATTPDELCWRVAEGLYDIVQPDATVLGGIGAAMDVFAAARRAGIETVVHNWGGAVCLGANYTAAFAGGARLAEWPMPRFPLRDVLMLSAQPIIDGYLPAPTAPGVGVTLTPEIEAAYAFRADAVYDCLGTAAAIDPAVWRVH
ncbi:MULTISPECIES: mandelate racemase/muconate lactonizing enzyme family protein [unclassified Chelatococcus]|uniref:mandelate racemase/muconate lactonizing enzyme family protein n=1 Tax=unclassified Chelatococcus TaxID=2638111 RepID=UPI001BCA866D|nr:MULTISPECIES: mandelate racemase/muconate lactonizing enzyme family protein [unclassified Chelatococcus]MBS7698879.1 mandelate racemase/muconate lactonizing enzyme family protein [Chelatococcus sp. YT9]MBX3559545.1 mandelate racemase/muconate lactonizing enzyme family protein [Chelatococcus sp.]